MNGWVFIIGGSVLIAIGGISVQYGWRTLSKPPDNVLEQIQVLYDRIDKQLSTSKALVDQNFKGYSLHLVLSIHRGKGRDRRYLYDLGNEDKGRISLYIDPADNLTFSLVDSFGEPYSIKVPPKELTFDSFFYLACEAGALKNTSFMKILIDGEQVAYQEIPTYMPMLVSLESPLKGAQVVLGAALSKKNGSEMDIVEIVEYASTLTTKDITQLLTYFKNKNIKQFIRFNGEQWLYRPAGGSDLIQEDDSLKPRFRKLSR